GHHGPSTQASARTYCMIDTYAGTAGDPPADAPRAPHDSAVSDARWPRRRGCRRRPARDAEGQPAPRHARRRGSPAPPTDAPAPDTPRVPSTTLWTGRCSSAPPPTTAVAE